MSTGTLLICAKFKIVQKAKSNLKNQSFLGIAKIEDKKNAEDFVRSSTLIEQENKGDFCCLFQ